MSVKNDRLLASIAAVGDDKPDGSPHENYRRERVRIKLTRKARKKKLI